MEKRSTVLRSKRHNRIAAVLAEKDTSYRELAVALGRSESVIVKWCRNEAQPQLNTFARIAEVLEVDIRELLLSTR